MPKTPGSGRKPGTPNKKSLKVLELLDELGYDPLVEAIKMLQREPMTDMQVKDAYELYLQECEDKKVPRGDIVSPKLFEIQLRRNELDADKRLDGHIKLIKYIYPARKAIEVSTQDDKQAPIFTIHMGNKNPSEEGK